MSITSNLDGLLQNCPRITFTVAGVYDHARVCVFKACRLWRVNLSEMCIKSNNKMWCLVLVGRLQSCKLDARYTNWYHTIQNLKSKQFSIFINVERKLKHNILGKSIKWRNEKKKSQVILSFSIETNCVFYPELLMLNWLFE